ncbi:MAG: hypothetical protein KAI17_23325 [Thiotrichaceae bacterium]|nr:hypothetical protein [Thiotrichaceae bacterium]
MINWLIRKVWGQSDNGWQKVILTRRDFLRDNGSPDECRLFLSRLELQTLTDGDDDPYFSCKEDEAWRQSIQARRRFIFSKKDKSTEEIWSEYSAFSDLIDDHVTETKKYLAHKLIDYL